MFHCSGWTYTWAVTAAGGTHVCLRRVDPALIFAAIRDHRVTHLCGAPIVLNLLIHAPDDGEVPVRPCGRRRHRRRRAAVGGDRGDGGDGLSRDAPVRAHRVLRPRDAVRVAGRVGPLSLTDRAQKMARQGVPMPTLAEFQVGDPETAVPVPRDGETLGEVMLRGNTIMKGYLHNDAATAAAFGHGLVSHGRSRGMARRQLHRDQGPQQGHHHFRRREHELAGSGGVPVSPSARDGGGGRGAARCQVGRDALRICRAEAGAPAVVPTRSSAGAANASRASRRRRPSSSVRCPRQRPARSRNSCCGNAPARCRNDEETAATADRERATGMRPPRRGTGGRYATTQHRRSVASPG